MARHCHEDDLRMSLSEMSNDPQPSLRRRPESIPGVEKDLADLQEIDRIRNSGEETVPWEQAKVDLRAQGVEVLSTHHASSDEEDIQV